MAYDERLARRVRRALARREDVSEKEMFGGLTFMVRGHMCCGIVRTTLLVRVDPDRYDALVNNAGARPMDFTGRPMRGFIFVSGSSVATAPALRRWLAHALDYVESRPAKPSRMRNERQSSSGRKNRIRA